MISPVESIRRQSISSGFTLVEMAVALLLMALISILMVEALRFGQRTYSWVQGVSADGTDLMIVQRFLRRSLESALPPPSDSERVRLWTFEGSAERIAYLAPAVGADGISVLSYYEVVLAQNDPADGGKDLVVRLRQDPPEIGPTQTVVEEVLIENVADAQWLYLLTPTLVKPHAAA